MKNILIIFGILFFYSAYAQMESKIDKLNVGNLKLPKEPVSKAVYINEDGQVKSSSVSDVELEYLSGATSSIQDQLDDKESSIETLPVSKGGTGSSTTLNNNRIIKSLDGNIVESAEITPSRAVISDSNGIPTHSEVTETELGYLSGLTDTIQNLLNDKADDSDVVKLTGDQSISGVKTFTGKIVASSTVNGSIPCPVMTQSERDLVSASVGDCVYNSTSLNLNVYDGFFWKEAGGSGGGISLWETGSTYSVDDVVIESNKIYRCLASHTSGVFSTDLADLYWVEVSPGLQAPVMLSEGGTGKDLTAVLGGIVYVDADSFEILSPGSAGQILQSNGEAAPSFVNKSISSKSELGSSSTLEEIQAPKNQLTETSSNKMLLETGNSNILANPGFEHSTVSTGWSQSSTGTALTNLFAEDVLPLSGKFSGSFTCIGGASGGTCSLFQDVTTKHAFQGIVLAKIKSNSATGVKLYSRVDAVNGDFVDVNSTNAGLYKIPTILGTTSTGIELEITVAASQTITVLMDDAIVAAQDLKQETAVCDSIECTTEFSAKVSSTGVVSGENLNWINSVSISDTSLFAISLKSGIVNNTMNCGVSLIDISSGEGASVTARMQSNTSSTLQVRTGFANTVSGFTKQPYSFSVICQKQGTDYTKAKELQRGSVYSTASDNFSTDTNTLTFKSTALTSADPVGTYNTYSYAINSNTRTICGTAPSTLPTRADGFRIFTRAYNAASTCGNPARVEIKIAEAGTVLPTLSKEIYKNTGKNLSGEFSYYLRNSDTISAGARATAYSEGDGVLTIDFGAQISTVTVAQIAFSDLTAQTSGYLVINAGKAKDSIEGSFKEMVSSQGSDGADIQSVYFGSSADCTTACTTGNCTICSKTGAKITSVSFVATGQYNLNGIDGTRYNCTTNGVVPGSGPAISFYDRSNSTSSVARVRFFSSALAATNTGTNSAICTGIP
jgi:hypothetical protein